MGAAYAHPVKVLGGTMLEKTQIYGKGYNATSSCTRKRMWLLEIPCSWISMWVSTEFRPTLIHFNGFPTNTMETIKEHGWWVLDDEGNCNA